MRNGDFAITLRAALGLIEVEDGGFDRALRIVTDARKEQQRIFFIGNGGSAAIASHMAADWSVNGKFDAWALNDATALTCIANDHGYESVYSLQLARHAAQRDVLVAISSSGMSGNILDAAHYAGGGLLSVVTLTGFSPENRLRKLGCPVNFYVPSSRYGIVETAHLAILHAILDKVVESSKE